MRIVRDILAPMALAALALTFTTGCSDDDDDSNGGSTGPATLHGVWQNIDADTTTTVELLANGHATNLHEVTNADHCAYFTFTYEADEDSLYIEHPDLGNAAYVLSNNDQTLTVHSVDDDTWVFTKIAAMPDLADCTELVPGGMSATIGGTAIEFAFAEGISSGERFGITATSADFTRSLSLYGLPQATGTYDIGGNQSQIVMIYTFGTPPNMVQYMSDTSVVSGTITISSYDGTMATGTFSGEVYQTGTQTPLMITNGTFSVDINEEN